MTIIKNFLTCILTLGTLPERHFTDDLKSRKRKVKLSIADDGKNYIDYEIENPKRTFAMLYDVSLKKIVTALVTGSKQDMTREQIISALDVLCTIEGYELSDFIPDQSNDTSIIRQKDEKIIDQRDDIDVATKLEINKILQEDNIFHSDKDLALQMNKENFPCLPGTSSLPDSVFQTNEMSIPKVDCKTYLFSVLAPLLRSDTKELGPGLNDMELTSAVESRFDVIINQIKNINLEEEVIDLIIPELNMIVDNVTAKINFDAEKRRALKNGKQESECDVADNAERKSRSSSVKPLQRLTFEKKKRNVQLDLVKKNALPVAATLPISNRFSPIADSIPQQVDLSVISVKPKITSRPSTPRSLSKSPRRLQTVETETANKAAIDARKGLDIMFGKVKPVVRSTTTNSKNDEIKQMSLSVNDFPQLNSVYMPDATRTSIREEFVAPRLTGFARAAISGADKKQTINEDEINKRIRERTFAESRQVALEVYNSTCKRLETSPFYYDPLIDRDSKTILASDSYFNKCDNLHHRGISYATFKQTPKIGSVNLLLSVGYGCPLGSTPDKLDVGCFIAIAFYELIDSHNKRTLWAVLNGPLAYELIGRHTPTLLPISGKPSDRSDTMYGIYMFKNWFKVANLSNLIAYFITNYALDVDKFLHILEKLENPLNEIQDRLGNGMKAYMFAKMKISDYCMRRQIPSILTEPLVELQKIFIQLQLASGYNMPFDFSNNEAFSRWLNNIARMTIDMQWEFVICFKWGLTRRDNTIVSTRNKEFPDINDDGTEWTLACGKVIAPNGSMLAHCCITSIEIISIGIHEQHEMKRQCFTCRSRYEYVLTQDICKVRCLGERMRKMALKADLSEDKS